MIINYIYGFKFEGILYGWTKDWELHKLPQTIKGITYAKKELELIDVGKQKGYLVGCKRKSIPQLKDMTVFINFEYQTISDKDCGDVVKNNVLLHNVSNNEVKCCSCDVPIVRNDGTTDYCGNCGGDLE